MLVNILKYMSELCKPSPLELDVLLYSSPTDFMPLRYTANWNSHQNIYSSHATSIEHKRTAQKFFNSCELTKIHHPCQLQTTAWCQQINLLNDFRVYIKKAPVFGGSDIVDFI